MFPKLLVYNETSDCNSNILTWRTKDDYSLLLPLDSWLPYQPVSAPGGRGPLSSQACSYTVAFLKPKWPPSDQRCFLVSLYKSQSLWWFHSHFKNKFFISFLRSSYKLLCSLFFTSYFFSSLNISRILTIYSTFVLRIAPRSLPEQMNK